MRISLTSGSLFKGERRSWHWYTNSREPNGKLERFSFFRPGLHLHS